jgi:hypothetical protein
VLVYGYNAFHFNKKENLKMAQTQAQYINMNLKRLANYINHLAALNKKYKEAIERVCSKSISDKIIKDESTLKYEKKMKESYKKAKSLYNDLRRIAENYKWGINVSNDIQLFNTRLNMTRLPILKGGILKIRTFKTEWSTNRRSLSTAKYSRYVH